MNYHINWRIRANGEASSASLALGLGSNGEYETEGGAVKIGTRRTLRYPLGDQMAPLLVDKHVCAMSYIGSRNSKACKGGHRRATNHPIAATTDL